MTDLISRASVLDVIDGIKPMQGSMEQLLMKSLCWAAVKTIQPVDAVPVVHGRPVWINPLDHDAKICTWKCSSLCSVCGDYVATGWNYCPNCGAKLDGERRESE